MGITWSQIITPLLVAALTGVVGGFCRYVSKRLNEMKVSNAALKDGQRDSLRYQIVQAHDYFTGKGCTLYFHILISGYVVTNCRYIFLDGLRLPASHFV